MHCYILLWNALKECKEIRKQHFLYVRLLIIFSLIPSDAATSFSGEVKSQDAVSNTSMVLEGKCVVVCDADVLPPSNKAFSYKVDQTRNRRIAFSAMRNENRLHVSSWNRGTVVTFDYVLVNYGRGYNPSSSTFTATVNGVYMFQFTVFKHILRTSLSVALTVNGNPVFSAYADGNISDHEMASNSGLIGLEVGDVVRIEVLIGELDGGWEKSTFSGFLIYETYF